MPCRAFLDTNALLDLMFAGRPGSDALCRIADAHAAGACTLLIAASSLKDVYYIARKELSDDVLREWIAYFLDEFEVVALDRAACRIAVNSDEPDFEDGVMRAMAETHDASCIVSRDKRAFRASTVRRLEPDDLVRMLDAQ